MNKRLLLFLFLCVSATVFSQNKENSSTVSPRNGRVNTQDGTVQGNNSGTAEDPVEKPPIELYRIISTNRDTTYVDTTLNIRKNYKYNYLRKDDFELLPFTNVGQVYNSLGYTFSNSNLMPKFVAQGRHANFMTKEDVNYYHVPTPLTELYFKTAFEQGQQLDALFTVNTSEQFNFSMAYKGVRSLGKYQHILTSTGNFRFSTNYHTKNNRYNIRAFVLSQDILNEENGGLQDSSILLFVEDDPEFADRGRLDVNFENAEGLLKGFTAYAEHEYQLIRPKDSISESSLFIGNSVTLDDSSYEYRQTSPFEGFGESYVTSNLRSRTDLEELQARAFSRFTSPTLGNLSAYINYRDSNYGYNSVLILDEQRITNRFVTSTISAGASYRKTYKGFELFGDGAINISGDFDGNYLKAGAGYRLNDENKVRGEISIHSAAPNYNFLLFQNDYKNYNWQTNFENVKTQELKLTLESKKFFDAEISYTGIDNHAYFGILSEEITPKPIQSVDRIDYLKVKVGREFRYGKFAFDNTIMYQNVLNGEFILNVPEVVSRNTLYYTDEWFKKAMLMQAGVSVKYFTKFNINAYDPVLGEFYTQNSEEIGGFPLVDLFFDAKVRQTRIYFKWEHINALFSSKNEYFSAPSYPYRDAVIRFGLVWDFFL